MSAEDMTCNGCMWLKELTKKLPHDLADHLCMERNWGGYVDPATPQCMGRNEGKRRLIAFAPVRIAKAEG